MPADKQELKFIYWFAHYNLNSPSVRYRGQYPLTFLKQHSGIESHFVYPSYKPLRILYFLRVYFSALLFRKSNSIIVIQRIRSNFIYANALKFLIKASNAGTVYDIDDADYLEYPPATINFFIKNCKAVFVGSRELCLNLTGLNPNIIINTSPTPDLSKYKNLKNKLLTIGWIGDFGGGHKESLVNTFFPALRDLPFKVRIILLGVIKTSEINFLTHYFETFDKVSLEIPGNIDWTDEILIQERISEFDIGIATLVDNESHRSKSAFKAKQYLNNGIPVLSSNIAENNVFVQDGINGFLCENSDDFRRRIIEISEMSDDKFKQLSVNARKSIVNFDLNKYCNTLLLSYEKTL
jgi:glycosyltransferase involved in cell wall biosynthesis